MRTLSLPALCCSQHDFVLTCCYSDPVEQAPMLAQWPRNDMGISGADRGMPLHVGKGYVPLCKQVVCQEANDTRAPAKELAGTSAQANEQASSIPSVRIGLQHCTWPKERNANILGLRWDRCQQGLLACGCQTNDCSYTQQLSCP